MSPWRCVLVPAKKSIPPKPKLSILIVKLPDRCEIPPGDLVRDIAVLETMNANFVRGAHYAQEGTNGGKIFRECGEGPEKGTSQ